MNRRRSSGILLHPTSLPSGYGIGDLGDEVFAFLDWAASAGVRVWQVLPLNPPGYGNSPYGCLSSFAGNPLLISPQRLLQEQLLPPHAADDVPLFPDDHVDYDRVIDYKMKLLRISWSHFAANATDDQRGALTNFESDPRQREWLDGWALFMALKERNGGRAWTEWDPAETAQDDDIRFHKYVQWLFYRQWAAVRQAAHDRHIRIMGDVPIYVAHDSADVWGLREIFQLDANGQPHVIAGVPPDYFSATGQRWGNPLYRWDVLRESGYRWWVSRIHANLQLADIVRLDHFRGFAAYWEIPASESTAMHGRWMPGPGRALFEAIRADLGELPLVAEDLGFITPEVNELRKSIGIPGMRILQFAFGQADSPHLPHRYDPYTVVYTGTHDNDTARGWYENAPPDERRTAETYLGDDGSRIAWAMIRAVFTSVAYTAIVPVQDILGLGSEARMNRPGAGAGGNWSWRLTPGALTRERAAALRRLAHVTGRV
jgi:4-alpha-glucanotransferase